MSDNKLHDTNRSLSVSDTLANIDDDDNDRMNKVFTIITHI
jgi:hypothetical protein